MKCKNCGANGHSEVKDSPYKDKKGIRIVRWSPENINIKFNDF